MPNPVSVSVKNITNPDGGPLFIPRGITTNVSLACSVTLSMLVDIPVTINYGWTGKKFMKNSEKSIRNNTDTDMITISPLSLEKAGVYTCKVTVRSNSTNMFIVGAGTSISTTNVALCKFLVIRVLW